jgi:signal transduction histidine kinase
VSIRKTLLVAFLAIGLGASIVLVGVAFVKAREALRVEIDRNARTDATALAAEINRTMHERLQNAAVWSRLDIMQDIRIRDIDKRLSQFLADLQTGYRDAYDDISCTDRTGQIVASSAADLVGTTPPATEPWLHTSVSRVAMTLSLSSSEHHGVLIEVPVSASAGDETLGTLRLNLNATVLEGLLDHAAGETGRSVVLFDGVGSIIAVSRALRALEPATLRSVSSWRERAGKVTQRNGAPLVDGDVLLAAAPMPEHAALPHFDWIALIIQPVDLVLAPVHRMAMTFLLLLGVIALLTAAVALGVSRTIARPIAALTEFTQNYVRTRVLHAPASGGTGEVGQLSDAFVQMVQEIDASQKKLVRVSKLAAVGEMSAVIAHEVRTPLGIMRSSAQLLAREGSISAEGRELAGFIESETDRLNRLVSAMLDSARPRPPLYADVDFHDLLPRAVGLLGAQLAKGRIEVTLAPEARDSHVECDEEQMTQVLLNILMNALQVLAPGGRIDVRTCDDGDALAVEIADDGPGIPPDERSRVFDAFFFKREGGVGLGLAIVQQIVHSHGGSIEVSESSRSGALFALRMPRQRSERP